MRPTLGALTLTVATQAAGLVQTLSGPGPFTVFAPTDAVLAAPPVASVETLPMPEKRETPRKVLPRMSWPAT